jgi:hypothetical protein
MSAITIESDESGEDFSLVLGGPLFQIFRRAYLSGNALELLRRRILVITMISWLPLSPALSLAGLLLWHYGAFAFSLRFRCACAVFDSPAASDELLIGSSDIQSLADMGNSYQVIREMTWLPFSTKTVLQLGVTAIAPVLPLTLTLVPLDQLLDRLLKIIF